jgi:internalin A
LPNFGNIEFGIKFLPFKKPLQMNELFASQTVSDIIYKADKSGASFVDLKNWHVTEIPKQLLALAPKLKSLDLSYNDISSSSLSMLQHFPLLQQLNLTGCNINEESAKFISLCTPLLSLNLSRTNIGDNGAKFIGQLTNLTSLNLRNTFLGEKGAEYLAGLTNLISLNISANHIGTKGVEYIGQLISLKILDISANKINDEGAKVIGNLTNIKLLECRYNKISEKGAEGFAILPNLSDLDLQENEITTLIPFKTLFDGGWEIEFNKATSSRHYVLNKRLYVFGNPIVIPPKDIYQAGTRSIKRWFDAATSSGLRPLHECKLIFIGDGEVGKTSLMKKLVFNDFDIKESQTHGINKIAWKDGIKNENGEPITVNLWDFGGQDIQHSLHQFFLSNRVIYVLVMKPRNDQRIGYWLDQIAKQGEESDLIVVYNWHDRIDIEAKFLGGYEEAKKTYKIPLEPSVLSCRTGEGIDDFKKRITEIILGHRDINKPFPNNWFSIKNKLEVEVSTGRFYIDFELYSEWCNQFGYTNKEDQKELLMILNRIGSIVFFNRPVLNRLQILNPEWITTGAYAVITSSITSRNNGHINYNDLCEIFSNPLSFFSDSEVRITYNESQFHFIMELMLEYQLCAENPWKKNEYLIPSALAGRPNDYLDIKRSSKEYRFQFKASFEMIVIHKFIAKNLNQSGKNDFWQSGILIHDKTSNTQALIETNLYSKIIQCWIKGDNIRGYWESIRRDMKDIFDMYHNFDYDELVGYEHDNKTYFISYEEMLNAITDGILIIPYHSPTRLKNLDVLNVLDMFEDTSFVRRNMETHKSAINDIHINVNVNQHNTSPNLYPSITSDFELIRQTLRELQKADLENIEWHSNLLDLLKELDISEKEDTVNQKISVAAIFKRLKDIKDGVAIASIPYQFTHVFPRIQGWFDDLIVKLTR